MALKSIPPPPREPITKDYVSSNWDMWFSVLSKRVSEIVVAAGAFGTVTSVTVATPGAGLFSSGSPITVAGTINITLNDDVAAIEALTGLGHLSRTGANTWALSTTIPWADVTGTPTTIAGYGITNAQVLSNDLTAIDALVGNTGFLIKTALDTWALDTATYSLGSHLHTGVYEPASAALTALGAGSAFVQFTGPTTSTKVFTLPDASSTLLFSGGALGTPASGVATNLTGTAAGLTAGNVTTNANLTGVVTSVGNATAIADAALSIAKTSGLQAALDLKAPLASPALTGVPTSPTAATATNTTQLATTAFVQQEAAASTAILMQFAAAHG